MAKYPILYPPDADDFFNMGLGPLTTSLTATVAEERNGSFVFEAEVLTDDAIYPLIEHNGIIKADAGHKLKDQLFRVKRIVPSEAGKAQIYAEHVSYLSQELSLLPEVKSVSLNANSALSLWKASLNEANPFVVDSDITTTGRIDWRIDKVANPRQALGGVEGSLLDIYGGEYRFDNYHISLLKKRGTTANTVLAYGRNIKTFEQEENLTSTYTSVYPFAIYKDENDEDVLLTIDGYTVHCANTSSFPNPVVKPIDFSSEFEHDETPTKAKLKSLAEAYIVANDFGIPSVSIKVSFVDLAKTADYAEYQALEEVNLCDDVRVIFPKLGVNTVAKVTRTVWNVLSESYDEIEIGERRASLSTIINDQGKQIGKAEENANNALVSANGKNTTFYGLYGPDGLGEPKANKVGDLWYKPNGDETEMYQWNGTIWEFVMSTAPDPELIKAIEEVGEKVEQAQSDAKKALTNANDAVDKANQAAAKADASGQAAQLAIEQSANAVTQAQQAIKDAADLLDSVTELSGTIADITVDIDTINKSLAVKVDQTEFNKLEGTVTNQSTLIEANAQAITQKASQTSVNQLTDEVTSTQSQLAVQAGEISALNTLTDTHTTQIGSLVSSYEQLSSTIAVVQNDVDNISVGARNLIRNSTFNFGFDSNWSAKLSNSSISAGDADKPDSKILRLTGTTGNTQFVSDYITIADQAGEYVFSFDGRVNTVSYPRGRVVILRTFLAKDGDKSSANAQQEIVIWSSDLVGTISSWQRVVKKIKLNGLGRYLVVVLANNNTSDYINYYRELQFEAGNKESQWSPNPEDYATVLQFSNLTQTVDTIQTTVADKANQSQVTQLSDQITSVVSTVNGHTSQITQLATDINLRVQKDDVINQINISPESILIAGEKIQITGQTYIEAGVIKTAHIADGVITTAKIGDAQIVGAKIQDASIGSAKIINLDASKIVAANLSTITANTGTLNVTGYLNILNQDTGIYGSYDYGDVVAGSYNPRYYVGTWRIGNNVFRHLANIYTLTSDGGKGSHTGYFENSYGSDVIALRKYGNSTNMDMRARVDINSTRFQISDSWNDTSGVILTSAGTASASQIRSRGQAYFESSIDVTGAAIVRSTSDLQGDTYVRSILDVSGAAVMRSSLDVNGLLLARYNVNVDGMLKITGTTSINSVATYNNTTSGAANMHVTANGYFARSTSARKYKADIQTADSVIKNAKKVLEISPASWLDKAELAEGIANQRYYGFIADDFDDAGLPEVVIYENNQIEALAYDRISMYHNVILSAHEKEIQELNQKIETLEQEIRVLQAA